MQETGKVISIGRGRAEVEMQARGECEHCGAHGICNWTGSTVRKVMAVDRAGAKPGDFVALEITEGTGLKSNLLVFGIPALGMLAGVLIGGLLINDLWSGILGGIGLVVGVGIVKLIDISVGRSGKSLPVIVRRLDKEECKGESSDKVAGSDSGSSGDDQRRG